MADAEHTTEKAPRSKSFTRLGVYAWVALVVGPWLVGADHPALHATKVVAWTAVGLGWFAIVLLALIPAFQRLIRQPDLPGVKRDHAVGGLGAFLGGAIILASVDDRPFLEALDAIVIGALEVTVAGFVVLLIVWLVVRPEFFSAEGRRLRRALALTKGGKIDEALALLGPGSDARKLHPRLRMMAVDCQHRLMTFRGDHENALRLADEMAALLGTASSGQPIVVWNQISARLSLRRVDDARAMLEASPWLSEQPNYVWSAKLRIRHLEGAPLTTEAEFQALRKFMAGRAVDVWLGLLFAEALRQHGDEAYGRRVQRHVLEGFKTQPWLRVTCPDLHPLLEAAERTAEGKRGGLAAGA